MQPGQLMSYLRGMFQKSKSASSIKPMSLHLSVHAAQKEMCLLNLKAIYVESGVYFYFILFFYF